ncbi:PadR family transcriptional regulator [Stackebrandtia soli]|uniref:PadR family transcriptional regulator n=1 Tax=Stackebrandtia soli TaxID=1892856 RepID=UPI0039E8AC07
MADVKLRVTPSVAQVLAALLSAPDADHYGMQLMEATDLPSGTLYPILVRLDKADWVTTAWEDIDPREAGRPARRYYTLTPDGAELARAALTKLYRALSDVPGVGKPRTV